MLDDKVLSRRAARADLRALGLRVQVLGILVDLPDYRYTEEDEAILVGLGFPPHVKE